MNPETILVGVACALVSAGLTSFVMSYVWSGSIIEWYQRRRNRRAHRLGKLLVQSHPEWMAPRNDYKWN